MQGLRVVVTASFLGLFGFAAWQANALVSFESEC
jgi:hypothetical protein